MSYKRIRQYFNKRVRLILPVQKTVLIYVLMNKIPFYAGMLSLLEFYFETIMASVLHYTLFRVFSLSVGVTVLSFFISC